MPTDNYFVYEYKIKADNVRGKMSMYIIFKFKKK